MQNLLGFVKPAFDTFISAHLPPPAITASQRLHFDLFVAMTELIGPLLTLVIEGAFPLGILRPLGRHKLP